MHRDLQLAVGGLGHVVGKLLHVFGLEGVGAVTRWQIPFGLRKGHGCSQGGRTGKGEDKFFHFGSWLSCHQNEASC